MTGGTIERARDRWREILPLLGVDTRFLTNRHGPCPLCGGRDRYRFDDREGTGSYFCSQCGAGVGVHMLCKLHGWTFKEACDEIDRVLGDIGYQQQQQPAAAPQAAKKNGSASALARIERALADARSPEIVGRYLQKRGLTVASPVLLGDQRAPYFVEEIDQAGKKHWRLIGRYPAVVAPIHGPDGSLVCAHRIYDADLDPRKKSLPAVGTINGGAVRLFEPDEELAVGEGIETCLAVRELFKVPIWAALTATGISTFEPPPGLMRLHIFADNDRTFTGQAAAFALAKRVRRDDFPVEVHVPPIAGTDWLDVLNADRGGA